MASSVRCGSRLTARLAGCTGCYDSTYGPCKNPNDNVCSAMVGDACVEGTTLCGSLADDASTAAGRTTFCSDDDGAYSASPTDCAADCEEARCSEYTYFPATTTSPSKCVTRSKEAQGGSLSCVVYTRVSANTADDSSADDSANDNSADDSANDNSGVDEALPLATRRHLLHDLEDSLQIASPHRRLVQDAPQTSSESTAGDADDSSANDNSADDTPLTAMHYCGHVPHDDTITATGEGPCSLPTDESSDLSACEVKCDGCPECVGFLLQPDSLCYFYQQLTAASSVSYSTSENPEGQNYYINARSDLCSDPRGDLSA